MRKALFLGLLAIGLVGISPAQQKKQPTKKEAGVKPEEVRRVLLSGFEQDPRFLWKLEQDESQRICSQYPSREAMPAQAIQRVIELENKNIVYPQWGLYCGDWKEGKKLVNSPRGGRYASYGFSDKPTDKGGELLRLPPYREGCSWWNHGTIAYRLWKKVRHNQGEHEHSRRLGKAKDGL
jgi:sulfur-oxidizing protein SoxX